MKVLYVVSATQVIGGGSKSFLNLLYGVMNYGIDPLVVCPDRGMMYQNLQKQGIKVANCFYRYITYPPFDKNAKNILLFLPSLFGRIMANTIGTIQLYRICKTFKPDIIHTNVSVTGIGYYASRLLRIPHVWHIREYGALDFNYYYYYPSRPYQLKRYRKNNSYTICITKDIQCYNGLEHNDSSYVVYDGVLSTKHLRYNPLKKPYFLFVGRIEWAKGVLPFLQAYAEYCTTCHNPLPLHLAGSLEGHPNYVAQCYKVVKEAGIEEYVSFLGEQTDILPFYSDATALIVPSLSEGFGFITAEAMFSGCLVVGHDVAGTKEQFDNGVELTGEEIALRYTQQEQLVQHLLDITDAVEKDVFSARYEPMILRAQQVVKQLYTSERNAEQIFQEYQKILKP